MKATAGSLPLSSIAGRNWVAVWADLVKARLTFLVLLTTTVGFYLGSPGRIEWPLLFHALIGTGMLACGASALNQLLERDHDARMRRTASRPLPSGRLQPETVLWFGTVSTLGGLACMALTLNALATLLGALTAGIYLFVYTPLKRVTWLNTLVGAIPGGLPPLIGWTAARGGITFEGAWLFSIQFLWQMPHFLAIAWMYRTEYAQAGFQMLSTLDPDGKRTGRQAVVFALSLLAVSVVPVLFGGAGSVYACGALALGCLFAAVAGLFACRISISRARRLFLASILYLPLLLLLMVLDRARTF